MNLAAMPSTLQGSLTKELAKVHHHRSLYEFTDHPILERQRLRESNARSYPRRLPLALKRAQGIYVEDVEGRVFIDCLAGAGTLALGHNHPAVIEALEETIRSGLPLHTLDLTTPIKDKFVQDLFSMLPREFADNARIQFCGPTGSDGVEAALKLVKIATGRNTVLAFHGAYHGMTQGALSMMGNIGPKTGLGGHLSNVQFLPFPYSYRCPFGLSGEDSITAGLHYIENILSDPESGIPKPAAIILETVQGEGGVIPAPISWLKGIRQITQKYDVPLIIDEVQTGFGRTGRLFSFEHADIEPDVVVLSKAIGGGLPLSVVVYHKRLDVWKSGSHAGTFRGNQLAMAAGSATFKVIREEKLHQAAASLGENLVSQLEFLGQEFQCVGEVRGRGLMIGMEIVKMNERDSLNPPLPNPELALRLQRECLRRGLIIELGGRYGSVLRFLPPLIINNSQIDEIVSILAASLAATSDAPH
jgi:diaminobutyrate-2-oxoglutarate transaminase